MRIFRASRLCSLSILLLKNAFLSAFAVSSREKSSETKRSEEFRISFQ